SSISAIDRLRLSRDVPALIRLLGHKDPTIQWHAAEALGTMGSTAVLPLLEALHSPLGKVRLGAIEALSMIKDHRAVEHLIRILHHDAVSEVRWAATLALGDIGSLEAIPELVRLLRDDNRYIRYGAAASLVKLDWQPDEEADRIYQLIAFQDWDAVRKYGSAATRPLMDIFRDNDPATRSAIISLMGELGDTHSRTACPTALRDRDPAVRWKAVLASMNCGVASNRLPLMLAGRERTGPNPVAAAILNFLFLGIGYNYLGKWWGFPVFMAYMSIIVLAQLAIGPFLPYLIAYPVTAVLAVQTYYHAQRMHDSV
ncbi:MAG: HEAT repeat domain-containing protein, partial [Methanoregula sp.]|nr:HEAT repeat domain-containing protein [Methanoregula sp.]